MSLLLLIILACPAYGPLLWWLWREPLLPLPSVSTDADRSGRDRRAHEVRERDRVLFVCTGNSARSQMAEALLRTMAAHRFEVASAGTEPGVVHPLTIRVMAEVGIDIAHHRTKSLGDVGERWDSVITVCDAAIERCPDFPAKTSRLHWSVPDPASTAGAEAIRLAAFRQVRDELRRRVSAWLEDRGVSPRDN